MKLNRRSPESDPNLPFEREFTIKTGSSEDVSLIVSDWVPSDTQGIEKGKYRIRTFEKENEEKKHFLYIKTPSAFLPHLRKRIATGETTPADLYCSLWEGLHSRGLPTLEFVQVLNDLQVVMPDVLRDGGGVYGKHYETRIPQPLLDQRFLELNFEDIAEEANALVALANKEGVYLPSDEPFTLIVRLDGTYTILVLDISMTDFFDEHDSLADYYRTGNANNVGRSLEELMELRERIQQQRNTEK